MSEIMVAVNAKRVSPSVFLVSSESMTFDALTSAIKANCSGKYDGGRKLWLINPALFAKAREGTGWKVCNFDWRLQTLGWHLSVEHVWSGETLYLEEYQTPSGGHVQANEENYQRMKALVRAVQKLYRQGDDAFSAGIRELIPTLDRGTGHVVIQE